MQYRVTEAYENSNPDPIVLLAGDRVTLGEKSQADGPWPNWIYCVSLRTGKAGWTPVQLLAAQGGTAVATADYNAWEMTVAVGDLLQSDRELNGWRWCLRQADGQTGWVPTQCLEAE